MLRLCYFLCFSASGSNASGNRWAMSINLRHIPDGAEVTVTQPSLWSCLRSEMNVPTLRGRLGPSCSPWAVLPFPDSLGPGGPSPAPGAGRLSVLVDVLHRPEAAVPREHGCQEEV